MSSSGSTVAATIAVASVLGLNTACQQNPSHGHSPGTQPAAYSEGNRNLGEPQPDDGQWAMAPKDYANTRYSTLNQINAGNVANLKLAWTFSTGSTRGHEAAPLYVNNTLYIIGPFPNQLFALDAGTGALKWTYTPQVSPSAQGVACCDVVNRGGAYYNGRIYYVTLDLQAVAVDAQTGKEVFRTPIGDINTGETATMAPLVVKGKMLIGNSGGEFGARGWLTAVDADTGKIAWRAFTTGPDKDVLIGPNFKPYYDDHKGKDLGVHTWPGDAWKVGGGTVWGWISYDPELDLIYYGTANPGPWNPDARPGDNKWTSTIFARRPETGEAIWAYQTSPHDDYDYDGVNECVLADINIGGQKRKVLMHPDRNGYMYVMDRTNGQVISAQPFGFINTSKGVDLKTGRIEMVKEKSPKFGVTVRDVCPAAPGAKDWTPSAFSFRTGMLYIPHNNLCMEVEGVQSNYIAGTPYIGTVNRFYAGEGGHRGEYTAFDPATGKIAWKIKENFPVWSGTVVTAGDIAFYGTMDRWFKALDIHTGKELWKFQTGSGIIGQPVTYKGPDGKQYVAILAGVGGWAGAVVSGGLDPRDGTGAAGFVNAMGDLKQATNAGGALYVFTLP